MLTTKEVERNRELARMRALKHMQWQVKWRSESQACCLKLFESLDKHPKKWAHEYFFESEALTGAAFSLWRAVFLGDKKATREAVFQHSKRFLESVLLDNAISYVLDKNNNEWTFNYYVNNARYRLIFLSSGKWKELVPTWERKNLIPTKRWEYAHGILNEAVTKFGEHLDKGA